MSSALLLAGERRSAVRPSWLDRAWPLALYLVLSIVLFGLPVIGHLDSRVIAADQIDSSALIWLYGWWPHAILHGINPFVTYQQFYPNGFNLQWTTSVPLEAILLTPVTLTAGPTVSWNVVALLAPALSAWTAFLLCRHVTRSIAPSLVGGYLFGFSPYMLLQIAGAPSLAMVALLPVFVLLVLKLLEGSIGRRAFVVAMALAIAAQYLSSSEILATATLFGAVALLAAYSLLESTRPLLRETLVLLALAFASAAVLVSPWLYFFLFGHHYPPGATGYQADLSSFVLPPELVAAQLHSGPPYRGSNPEGYLSIPLIALVVMFCWRRRHDRAVLVALITAVVVAVASLGKRLVIRGDVTSIWMPWDLVRHLPVIRYLIPVRFGVLVMLPVALLAALALSERSRGWRVGLAWALAVATIALIAPNVGDAAWNTEVSDPPFFTEGIYRHYLRSTDHVLTIPVWGPNERWLADAGFPFALSAGYLGNPFPPSYSHYPIWGTLLTGHVTADSEAQLRRFIADKKVTAVIVDDSTQGPWRKLFGTLGIHPVDTGGVLVYRLRGPT